MSAYQSLSIVQFVFILFCGISVLDFGIGMSQINDEDANGLGLNELIFEDAESDYWGAIQFWGYCMIIVAILQLMKAFSVDNL